MVDSNVQSSRGVTLVGGGAPQAEDVRLLMSHAPDLVAADGGANACLRFGLPPLTVIGDFDSLTAETREALPQTRFIHIAEQDSTDFQKCLANIRAPFVLATGFIARRVDHTLAALSALARHNAYPVILLGEKDIAFSAPPSLVLPLDAGTRVSLFPVSRVQGRSTGLKWPIDGLTLSPDGRIGTSNEATGPITLDFDQNGCLVILPRAALVVTLAALTG
ncbi:MAG: thiamine diphosphokinase [Pseudomonadota bacterium]